MGCAQATVLESHPSALQADEGSWHDLYVVRGEIGRGSFGRVHVVCSKHNGSERYAAKFVKIRKYEGVQDPLDELDLRLTDLRRSLNKPRIQRNAVRRREIREQCQALEIEIQLQTRQMPLREIISEIKMMQFCAHPRVLGIRHFFTSPEEVVIVMPFCPTTLQRAYPRLGWDCEKAPALYFADMCEGVLFIHSRGVIHRDLKPDNMMIMADGRLCVADFGLATTCAHASSGKVAARVGTANYLPPERLQLPAGDMWALGCVVFWMIFGKVWHLSSLSRQLDLVVQREKASIRGLSPIKSDASISTCASDEDDCAESRLSQAVNRVVQLSRHPLFERSTSCRQLLLALLAVNPVQRISPADAVNHHWLSEDHPVRAVRKGASQSSSSQPNGKPLNSVTFA
mmetsp:Transcript_25747/g.56774  ORF Transcript_25747/g.56774 Transcript_25747/m.56774 type:complete len:400 (+) Transcript_25747:66-1265(+)